MSQVRVGVPADAIAASVFCNAARSDSGAVALPVTTPVVLAVVVIAARS
jgi:hypothetical protein